MADSTPSSKAKTLPNFYSAAADMYGGQGGGESKPAAQPGADSGEKAKSVATLLEVVKKMDGMETDPESKKLLQQMITLAEQYMEKVQPGSGAGKTGDAAGGGASSASASPAGAGGAGATVGDKTGASAVM